jgi:hypothetical protein
MSEARALLAEHVSAQHHERAELYRSLINAR